MTERSDEQVEMATVEECEQAIHRLAERLANSDGKVRNTARVDRTITCRIPDLGIIYGGRIHDGRLIDIIRVDNPDAQLKLTVNSEDLLLLSTGELRTSRAWASGRLKVDASFFDLLRLRSLL